MPNYNLHKEKKISETNQPKIGFVITHPLTGLPIKKTPDGISLKDKVFSSEEALKQFINEHWKNAVFCADVKG